MPPLVISIYQVSGTETGNGYLAASGRMSEHIGGKAGSGGVRSFRGPVERCGLRVGAVCG